MAKIIKKVVKKKAKVVAKKRAVKAKPSQPLVTKKRKTKKDLGPEIIFDSRVGKTDALFVDEPTPELKMPELFSDSILDPELNKSLQEFDAIQNPQPEPQAQPTQKQSKRWWQKLFKI